jgi:formylglycine-generating enzyme required for sulfatase activity
MPDALFREKEVKAAMKCSNPECGKEISNGCHFCPKCGTKVVQQPEKIVASSGVCTGDIGYMEGNMVDDSRHGAASVGSIKINVAGAPAPPHAAPALVMCPACGRRNEEVNTFKCVKCGRDHLCLRHFEDDHDMCRQCAGALRGTETLRPEGGMAPKASSENMPEPFSTVTNTIGMTFVLLPPGSFLMGSPPGEGESSNDEVLHRVTLTKAYYIQTTPVTQGQWRAVMGDNPSLFDGCGDDCPVEQVIWKDAQEFINALNRKEGTSKYRLPTEAEWEYACRAGSSKAYCFGSDPDQLCEYAWYSENSDFTTHPVAQKKPNRWGLYDMHGNVLEWCSDWFESYPVEAVTDPTGPLSGAYRVLRGGSFFPSASRCRSAIRYRRDPGFRLSNIGFRLAGTL